MNAALSDGLTIFNTICWPVCFWWMHLVSRKQNDMLEKLKRESEIVRRLSKEEHEVVHELRPKVEEISRKLS